MGEWGGGERLLLISFSFLFFLFFFEVPKESLSHYSVIAVAVIKCYYGGRKTSPHSSNSADIIIFSGPLGLVT